MARRDWGGSCAPQHQTQVIFPLDLPLPCSSGCPLEILDDPPARDLRGATDAAGTKPMLRMRPPGSRCWCQILWGLVLLSPRCGCCLLPCGAFFGGEPCSPYPWCLAREIFWHLQSQNMCMQWVLPAPGCPSPDAYPASPALLPGNFGCLNPNVGAGLGPALLLPSRGSPHRTQAAPESWHKYLCGDALLNIKLYLEFHLNSKCR